MSETFLSSAMQRSIRNSLLPVSVLGLLLTGGCTRKISGVYKDSSNLMTLDFQSDGKVYSRIMGVPIVADYQERGNKIIFKGPEGDTFVDIVDANTLSIDHPLSQYTGKVELRKEQ